MNWVLFRLSGLMFLEFAVWGAWMPVLALRLLGPLKMTGKQTGWVYATFPLACIFAPFASGYLADKWFNAEWIILVSHAIGAVLLFAAARQTKFWGMFCVMFVYAVFYTATLPLVNKMLFQQLPESACKPWVFLWAARGLGVDRLLPDRPSPMCGAPAATGPTASIWPPPVARHGRSSPSARCRCRPASAGNPLLDSLAMLKNVNYLIFILAQLAVSGMMQFYFLGTGQFLQDRGVSGKNVSAVMALAQAVQAAATFFLLGWLLDTAKFQGPSSSAPSAGPCSTLTYVASKRIVWIVLIQAFHGLAYVFFMIGGQIFVGTVAPQEIGASAQSLIFIATNGIGLFLGTQLAGYVMEKNSAGGKFQWSKIWAVPLAITLAGAIVFAVVFKTPSPADFRHDKPVSEEGRGS